MVELMVIYLLCGNCVSCCSVLSISVIITLSEEGDGRFVGHLLIMC